MKKQRLALILELIERYDISTQEELASKLNECGFHVTQATVSRDIKELRLIKQPSSRGVYRYTQVSGGDERYLKYYSIFAESVTGIDCAQNICMLKCHSGMANAACAAIDALNMNDVLGTIAGDDTVFILCRTEKAARDTKVEMQALLGT